MRKRILSFALVMCFMMSLVPSAFASGNVEIKATASPTSVAAGDTFTYTVKIGDPGAGVTLGGVDATVSYDNDKLECTSVVNGGAFATGDMPNGVAGVSVQNFDGTLCIRAVATVMDTYDLSKDFIVATFKVKDGATGNVSPVLEMKANGLFDDSYNDLPFTLSQASVSAGGVTPADPAKPTISVTGTYTYNGSEQAATVTGFDSATMNISGNKGTNAGGYTVSVTSKTGKWADGSGTAVTAAWKIEKATPGLYYPHRSDRNEGSGAVYRFSD